jgi:hypothetical protein
MKPVAVGALAIRDATAKGHMVQPRPAARLQEFAGEMASTADARRAVVHALRPLGEREILGQRAGRHAGMHDQHVGKIDRQADRRDVGLRVVARVLHRIGIDRQDADIGQQDGVAVGRRSQHFAGRQIAAGAGLVVDHDRQAAAFGQLLRQDAGHDVAAAARREADQQPDLLRRKRLRPGCTRQQAGCRGRPDQRSPIHETILPCLRRSSVS